jgi:hypothetical protein
VLVISVSISENLFIVGDINGHVGSTRVRFDGVHEVSSTGVGTKKEMVS